MSAAAKHAEGVVLWCCGFCTVMRLVYCIGLHSLLKSITKYTATTWLHVTRTAALPCRTSCRKANRHYRFLGTCKRGKEDAKHTGAGSGRDRVTQSAEGQRRPASKVFAACEACDHVKCALRLVHGHLRSSPEAT